MWCDIIFKRYEIGNIFKLGTKYSESLELYYTDSENTLKPVVMGCYGIGLERVMAAVAEQSADEKVLFGQSILRHLKFQ